MTARWEKALKALDVAYRVYCDKADAPGSVVALEAAIHAYEAHRAAAVLDEVRDTIAELREFDMPRAADRLEALEAQLERQGRLVDWYQEQYPEQLAVIETMAAALDKIIASEADPLDYEYVVAIARAALKEPDNADR